MTRLAIFLLGTLTGALAAWLLLTTWLRSGTAPSVDDAISYAGGGW